MKRRAFTLIELLIVISIIAIIAAVGIPALLSTKQLNVSTPVNLPPTTATPTPERSSGYEVHTVSVTAGMSMEATRIHETLVSWLREHQGCKVVSVIRTDGGMLVIITENR